MPQNTIISKLHYSDSDSKTPGVLLPQNNVLYVDQFTDEAPDECELFQPTTMQDVFRHYAPSKHDVKLINDEGEYCCEDFCFNSLDDFDDEQIIAQSHTLQADIYRRDACLSIDFHLAHNTQLKDLLANPEASQALREVLVLMRKELQQE